MLKMKTAIGIIVLVVVVGSILIVSRQENPVTQPTGETKKIDVIASFYPLAFIAKQVGGEAVVVSDMTPSGAEPHDFEPSPRDIARVYDADFFLYHGAGLDPWAERIASEAMQEGVVTVKAVDTIPASQVRRIEEEAGDHVEEEDNDHGRVDPHVWLSPQLLIPIVTAVRDQLIALDPAHEASYAMNSDRLIGDLTNLHAQFLTELAQCQTRTVIASHDAFGYLGEAYDLDVIAISGLSPEDEPTPARLAEVSRLAKEKKVTTIFFETLVSPRLAQTVARESGLTTAVLNPIEGLAQEDSERGDTYLSLMQHNLSALKTALVCQ